MARPSCRRSDRGILTTRTASSGTQPSRLEILKRGAGPVGAFLAYIEETWLSNDLNEIEAFLDEPKTLEELHADVDQPRKGTQVHHIVEQTPARQDDLNEEDIESRRNKVRIPTLIHREITNWYNTRNDAYGGVKPRVYLRGKSFDERWKFGVEILKKFGVLKP